MSIVVKITIEMPEVGKLWDKGQFVSIGAFGLGLVPGEVLGYSLTDEDAEVEKAAIEAETL